MADFVDVRFEKETLFSKGDLGRRPGAVCRSYGDVAPVIPESQWRVLIEQLDANNGGLEWLVTYILNQRNEGSCVGNATVKMAEVLAAKQLGKDAYTKLSAISVYKQIGSSPNSGAMIDDALDAIRDVGSLPLDTPENRAKFGEHVMPATGFHTRYPDGWKETAKAFRVTEFYELIGIGQLMTALFNGQPVVVGRNGHSICYLRPAIRNGIIGVIYANSWAESWGFGAGSLSGGFGFDSMGMVKSSAQWAFCGRSVVVP